MTLQQLRYAITIADSTSMNEAAKQLYNKLGYNPIGVRKRFYEKPVEDAIVMSKTTYTV